jgi:Zn-dependent peptidase ImmA (M78 family)
LIYDNLLDEADKENIYVIENAKFQSKASGLINNDVIGINKNVRSSAQRSCILAEELGHYHTSSGNILDQSSVSNRKQELHARAWAYNRLIGLYGIINAYRSGCRNGYEIAEHLNITEEFLNEALQYYKNKYGLCTTVDNYVIYFEPTLGIFEQI